MSVRHEVIFNNEVITLTKSPLTKGDNRGFWLYDKIFRVNIAMRANSEREAWIEALTYYQNSYRDIKSSHDGLVHRINTAVGQFVEDFDIRD